MSVANLEAEIDPSTHPMHRREMAKYTAAATTMEFMRKEACRANLNISEFITVAIAFYVHHKDEARQLVSPTSRPIAAMEMKRIRAGLKFNNNVASPVLAHN